MTAITSPTIARDINTYADLVAEQKALTEKIDALKAKFKEWGPGEYASSLHDLTVADRERATLNTREVQKLLTPAQVAAVTSVTHYLDVRVK